jgi:hypothetical protein
MKDGVVSGIEGLGEFLHIIIWHLRLLLGPHPPKICVRTRLTNSKIFRTDIQFASSKLTAAMRGSLSGCKVDADTSVYSAKTREQKTSEKEYISKHKRMSKSRKGGKV